ncbi:hypothetical protein CFN58_34780 [Pseudomonas avellanae]|uniref:Uncharacterized protein n=1 Tax=Pseudomonas avellanae TaxID=46257 RepID=A0A261W9Q0_9PSED|nr:hypothetical protein CFN58_34780 [Pseudomonas avellanae]
MTISGPASPAGAATAMEEKTQDRQARDCDLGQGCERYCRHRREKATARRQTDGQGLSLQDDAQSA